MSDRENLHVAILRFGEDKLENGVTFDELRQHLQDLGFTVDQEYLVLLFYHSYEAIEPSGRGGSEAISKSGVRAMLTADSYFRLIDYIELKEARESSQSARRYARYAMILTAVLAAASILITVTQAP